MRGTGERSADGVPSVGLRGYLMRYAVVIERAGGNYSAHLPDLPGCVATGATPGEAEEIQKAIRFHLDGLREDDLPIPEPTSICEYVEA